MYSGKGTFKKEPTLTKKRAATDSAHKRSATKRNKQSSAKLAKPVYELIQATLNNPNLLCDLGITRGGAGRPTLPRTLKQRIDRENVSTLPRLISVQDESDFAATSTEVANLVVSDETIAASILATLRE